MVSPESVHTSNTVRLSRLYVCIYDICLRVCIKAHTHIYAYIQICNSIKKKRLWIWKREKGTWEGLEGWNERGKYCNIIISNFKAFNTYSNQRNVGQKYMEIPPYSNQTGFRQVWQRVLKRMWRKRKSYLLLIGEQINADIVVISLEISQKLKNRNTTWPCYFTFGRNPENSLLQRCVYFSVYCCVIHNSQELEST